MNRSTESKRSDERRDAVRAGYAEVVRQGKSCCGPSCCEPGSVDQRAKDLGYQDEDLQGVPDEANLGLGCGNPTALAALKPGEVVVDLGSGAGIDSFIAAKKVGETGRVIGVDMTPEMLARARENAVKAGLTKNVEFREGIIEALPVVSDSVDVIISNCVINLSPEKPAAFREAFRVLKPGGRMSVSDVVLSEPLPSDVTKDVAAIVACIGGADTEQEYVGAIEAAGFVDLRITRKPAGPLLLGLMEDPIVKNAVESLGVERARKIAETVFSYSIEANKPA